MRRIILLGLLSFASLNIVGQNNKPIIMHTSTIVSDAKGIKTDKVASAWFIPNNASAEIGKFEKLEVGFKLDETIEKEIQKFIKSGKDGINPFNPEEADISFFFKSPSGKKVKTHGFYYQPFFADMFNNKWVEDTTSFHWRMRFAPDEIGNWLVKVEINVKNHPKLTTEFSFDCVKSEHKGILMTSHTGTRADQYLYLSETGKTFIPLGHNITTRGENIMPIKNELHKKWIKELGSAGGNFFRMEMPAGGALPDWPIYNNYKEKLGKMYGYDEVVDLAEALEMYFIMFRHHVEVGRQASWGLNWDCWNNNPYKKAYNLTTSEAYFTNKEVIKWQKNTLRYIFARWGYSPSFAFYGYSEVDLWVEETGLNEDKSFDLFADWFIETKNYIQSELHFSSNKFICSFKSNRDVNDLKHPNPVSRIIDESDVISLHSYSYKKSDNYRRFDYVNDFLKEWENKKPVLLEETGIENNQGIFCCTGLNFHNTIWASSFSGTMGTGFNWNWDRGIHSMGYYTEYQNLAIFFEGEDFKDTKYKSQRWKNDGTSTLKNATLENYALVSEDKEKVLGWIHNSTYYWRNLYNTNSCIKELVDNKGVLKSPCENEDKSPAIGSNPHGYTYDNKEFADKYSAKKGAVDIIDSPTFTIKGLKGNGRRSYNPWAKKHWYKIVFYTTNGEFKEDGEIQVLSTSSIGKLKPKMPILDAENPDYSYKIEYLGFMKKPKD